MLEGNINKTFDVVGELDRARDKKPPPFRMVFVSVCVMCIFFILTLTENIMSTFFNVLNNAEIMKILSSLRNTSFGP